VSFGKPLLYVTVAFNITDPGNISNKIFTISCGNGVIHGFQVGVGVGVKLIVGVGVGVKVDVGVGLGSLHGSNVGVGVFVGVGVGVKVLVGLGVGVGVGVGLGTFKKYGQLATTGLIVYVPYISLGGNKRLGSNKNGNVIWSKFNTTSSLSGLNKTSANSPSKKTLFINIF
jgi:hypothetical protein